MSSTLPFQSWKASEPRACAVTEFGVALGVWSGPPPGYIEATVLKDWLFTIQLRDYRAVLWNHGRTVRQGVWHRGSVELHEIGAFPSADICSPYAVARIAIPADALSIYCAENDLGAVAFRAPGLTDDPLMMYLGDALEHYLGGPHLPSRMEIGSLTQTILARCLAAHSDRTQAAASARSTGNVRDWRLRRAIEYLEARLAEDVGLDEVAAAVSLSPGHLAGLFRAGTGAPPHRWLMRRRIERACEMLAGSRQTVTQVAYACGFASSQHLATVFHRHKGTTPSAYRRERLS